MEANALQIVASLKNFETQIIGVRSMIKRYEDKIGKTPAALDDLIQDIGAARDRFLKTINEE